MGDLKVDTDVLWDAGTSLRTVYDAFKDADGRANTDIMVISHKKLRDRLDRRETMLGEIEGLGEIAEGAAEAYEEIETEFTKALEGQKK